MTVQTAQKRVAIVQSSYIPWKGYFDLIRSVDEFILFDDVQYTKRDWRNRNQIKTPQGLAWLTIPVRVKGRYSQRINETVISDPRWAGEHWKAITQSYARAPYFREYHQFFEGLHLSCGEEKLSQINFRFLKEICGFLGIRTPIRWSSDYRLEEGRTERLVCLCRQVGATEYLSGPTAKEYIQPELFERAGIRLSFVDYSGYPEYHQLYPPFAHQVSIIDLIFNEGPEALRYMKNLRG